MCIFKVYSEFQSCYCLSLDNIGHFNVYTLCNKPQTSCVN